VIPLPLDKQLHIRTLLGALTLGLVTRLLGISARPIWYDEAFAILYSRLSLPQILAGTLANSGGMAADVHPLAYYGMLHVWMQWFGDSLPAVRFLSVMAGVGGIGLFYWFTSKLTNPKVAIIAAGLVAISPFQVHYAQEIRMYSWMLFWLILATISIWLGMQEKRLGWWLVFSVSCAAAQYMHNLSATYLIVLAALPVLRRDWKAARKTMAAGVGALLLYLPWLISLPGQMARVSQQYWITPPSVARLITTFLSFVTNLPLPAAWLPFGLFVAIYIFVFLCFQTFTLFRRNPAKATPGAWLAYLTLTPVILLFVVSQLIPVYIERALLISGCMFMGWLAWTLVETPAPNLVKGLTWLLVIVGCVFGLIQHLTYTGFPYAPYRPLALDLYGRLQPGDLVLHSNKLSMLPMKYYDRQGRLPQRYLSDPIGSGADTLALDTQRVLELLAEARIDQAVLGHRQVYLLIFAKAIQEYQQSGVALHPHIEALEKKYQKLVVEQWGDLLLYVYEER
jgi:4-amino-4-deoxy-L-arabinose transferase-like glycosyltransferase